MEERQTIILGAGPSGLAAALTLHNARRAVGIIEKTDRVGGLSRTLEYGDFRTDIGPHVYYGKNQGTLRFVEETAGCRLKGIPELTRIWSDGKFFPYPEIKIPQALSNLGIAKTARIALECARLAFRRKRPREPQRSFEEYALSRFGKTLADLMLIGYTEKILGLPASEISVDWAQERTTDLSLVTLIRNILLRKGRGDASRLDRLLYPELGAGSIYDAMRRTIPDACFSFNSVPARIVHDSGAIVEITVPKHGNTDTLRPGHLISSIPVTELITLLDPPAPAEVLQAAQHLHFRSHVLLFLTIGKPSVFPDQWVYFPGKEVPFGRITESRNFSSRMSPPGKTSLSIEFFCREQDAVWNAGAEKLSALSMPWIKKIWALKEADITGAFVHRERFAYPLYDLAYQGHRRTVLSYLAGFRNLRVIGRSGCFTFNGQHQALEGGIAAAEDIIASKKSCP